MAENVVRVHTHTQGNLVNNKTNKANNISLNINVYKTDQLQI